MAAINDGFNVMNHLGHCNEHYALGLSQSQANNLQNTEFGFIYSQGCMAAAFDEATGGSTECISEKMITNESGVFAFHGNTKFGWGQLGSTDGASQAYDRSFFEAMYDEDIRELGFAMNYSREQHTNLAMTNDVMRWVYYEMVLFGDPSIEIKLPASNYPYLTVVDHQIEDLGNGDGVINPNDEINLSFEIANDEEWENSTQVNLTLFSEEITINQNQAQISSIASGESVVQSQPFNFTIPENWSENEINFELLIQTENESFTKTINVTLNVNYYQSGWPVELNTQILAEPIISPMNDSGERNVGCVDFDGNLYSMTQSGVMNVNFPVSLGISECKFSSYADLDNDGTLDVVASDNSGALMAFKIDGTLIFLFDCANILKNPVIEDINNDGSWNIIFFGLDRLLHCLDTSGNEISGFPVELPSFTQHELTVGNFTSDIGKEILINLPNGVLYAVGSDGSIVFNEDVSDANFFSDGILINNNTYAVGTSDHKLLLVDSANNTQSIDLNGNVIGSAIAADYDNDNSYEFACATANGFVYCFEDDLQLISGFPVELDFQPGYAPYWINSPDYNNDLILLLDNNANCKAVDLAGNTIDLNWIGNEADATTPAVFDDLDFDGDLELVVGKGNKVFAYDLSITKGESRWDYYRNGPRHTGSYIRNTVENQDDSENINFVQLNNSYPNPFVLSDSRATISIDFSLPKSDIVEINVYNVKGQHVKTLVDQKFNSGTHTINWKVEKNQASGIYFYKLKSSTSSLTRKMLILK
jgi:hypothetical protein